jgi:hypothetical protein
MRRVAWNVGFIVMQVNARPRSKPSEYFLNKILRACVRQGGPRWAATPNINPNRNMKTILAVTIPVIALVGLACFALTGTATAAQPAGKTTGPVAHTTTRHCGNSCHHHAHTYCCGGHTYYCCGSH